jgi:3-oxoacyl-(acyl-carrier-protein) synthase
MFLSPRLTGSPSISSPGRKVQQVILNEPKGKLFGLPSAKFQFKPWNEQPVSIEKLIFKLNFQSLHCDWSACGRYIVATTETAFTICDSESEWAQKSANNDHLELTSKFSAYAIPINFTFPSYFEKRK